MSETEEREDGVLTMVVNLTPPRPVEILKVRKNNVLSGDITPPGPPSVVDPGRNPEDESDPVKGRPGTTLPERTGGMGYRGRRQGYVSQEESNPGEAVTGSP